jgi:hypothetical protein
MFLVAFTNILSRFLQQNGIKCYLHCVYNYFSVAKNRNSKDLWRGKYSCTNPACDVFYVAYIKSIEKNGDVVVMINSNGEVLHDKQNKPAKITRTERVNLGKELDRMGALNVRANNIIENLEIKSVFEEPKVTNAKNLNVLKSQFRNSEKLSTKMFEDLSLVKQVYDFLISESIHGYIHFVGLFPFGFLLYMENQVSIIISNKLICFLRNLKVQNVDLYPSRLSCMVF